MILLDLLLYTLIGVGLWYLGRTAGRSSRVVEAFVTYSDSTDMWWMHIRTSGAHHTLTFTLPYVGPTPRP